MGLDRDDIRIGFCFHDWRTPPRKRSLTAGRDTPYARVVAAAPLAAWTKSNRWHVRPNRRLLAAALKTAAGESVRPLDLDPVATWRLPVGTCRACGEPFRGLTGFKTCSERCARELTNATRRKRRRFFATLARTERACAACGANFTPQRTTARFCSMRCRVAAHRASRAVV